MVTAADLQAVRDALVMMRARGVRSFRDQNGEEVSYASDREMAAALAAIDRELSALSAPRNPHTIVFRTKGF